MQNILNNDEVKNIIEKNEGYYSVMELNDVLYLNNKLYTKIECLQNLHNLKTLYLNNNALEKIDGLDCCINLIALYLNCNQIKKIENLNNLRRLRILNLEDNNIFLGCVEAFFEGGTLKEQEEMQKIEKQKKLQHRNSIECIILIKNIILKNI
ncbi:leucine-rich repeat protein [Plasmodium sp. DRC-Itaito]|nr:leucine-rich repeat protein [Plasmodium sp. DRC-Itaito]